MFRMLLGSLLCVASLFAQPAEVSFQRLSLDEGLSQSIVENILQDRRGFMWFCTEDGLNMYDGYRFTVIRSDPAQRRSLSYNQTTTIYEDRAGVLWIGAFNGGLNRYDPRQEGIDHFRHDPDDPTSLSNDIVRAIFQDRSGNLWVGTDGGLNRMLIEGVPPETSFVRFSHDPDDPNSLSSDRVLSIYQDRYGVLWIGGDRGLNAAYPDSGMNRLEFRRFRHLPGVSGGLSQDTVRTILEDGAGTLWIGTDGGLNRLNGERGSVPLAGLAGRFRVYRHDPADPASLSHNEIYALFEDHFGNFWVGTNGGGLNHFDRTAERFTPYRNDPRDPGSLSYDQIRSIYEDRSGNLWIGTYGGGISKLNRARKAFRHYRHDPDRPNSLNQNIVWSIYEDREGILWIGTHGGGLNRFDRLNNRFSYYLNDPGDPNSISSNFVRQVIEDRRGNLWLGTNGGGINRYERRSGKFMRYLHDPNHPASLSHNDIRALYEDRSGTLWVGTRGGGLEELLPGTDDGTPATFRHYRHDPADHASLSSDFIRTIFEDDAANIWVGTLGGGLNRLDRASGRFTHFRADPGNPDSLSNDYVFDIHQDRQGIIWLATWGGGLNKFDPVGKVFRHYSEKDGLVKNTLYGMLEDDDGLLWLSSDAGLSRFDPGSETFRNYSVEDGLQSKEFNGGAYFKSTGGELFFGGINGFNAFYPRDIRDNTFIPPVVVTDFLKLNQPVDLGIPVWEAVELHLSHQDYVFSLEFAALDYTLPEKNRYAYQMEGLDQDWIYTGADKRYATYTTLAPGEYTFRVKGTNNDGIWNGEGTAIRIIVEPPVWGTAWFRLLVLSLLLGAAYLLYRDRLRHVRMKTELEAAHAAQMSIMPQGDPHVAGFDISGVCIPANEVGGDFFDYIWLDEAQTRFGIVIGDVSGKAMKSAMTAVMADGMIWLEANETGSIRQIMTRVNHSMYRKTERMMFTALCLAALDTGRRELVFTNAGLSEPLLKNNGRVEALKSVGVRYPLGSILNTVYEESAVPLEPGDLLVFYTDGVSEAHNAAGEFYSDERLVDLLRQLDTSALSARQVKEHILQDLNRFSGNKSPHDDMTIIVVKVAAA